MKRIILTVAIILITALLLYIYAINATITTFKAVNQPTTSELLELTNAERLSSGAPVLVVDARLDDSAQRKADDMYESKYFNHVNPQTGKHGYEYIQDTTGKLCLTLSENLVHDIYDSNSYALVQSWVASPAHYKAMIDPKYTLTGFGIAGEYVVQHFCEVR